MILPPEPSDSVGRPLEFPERGTCPSCGSGEIVHHVRGLPDVLYVEAAPAWMVFGGCTMIGPDRTCSSCQHQWWGPYEEDFEEDEDDSEHDTSDEDDG
ncbi:hypothetical protein ACFQS2_13425 [Brachybacterium sp. GCM10030267]|uniref:hypothetical protein n=1 Tax=Brachybacterium sp. GCM10030267 TaxID=3273381 RepID=UPI00361FCD14